MNHSPSHETVVAVLILSAVLPINQQLLQAQYQRSCSGESRPGAFAQYYLPQTGGTQTLTIDLPNSTRWSVTNPARISWITINSSPEAAEILVDGKFVGSTPSTLRLAPGDHSISIERSGFESWKRTISLSPSANITIDAELKKTN